VDAIDAAFVKWAHSHGESTCQIKNSINLFKMVKVFAAGAPVEEGEITVCLHSHTP